MDLVGDRRGQSIQIGAVLLFAVLIIAFASYQAFVVPNQNRGVEFNHNQQVQSDMQDLRNAIVSARGTGEDRSVSVQLGTRYPSRLVARNPSPPSGSLNTVGTTDDSVSLRITNAQAAGETGDFWNESQRYNTGAIRYRPNYNVYANSPTTTYEQTVLYNQFPTGNITLSNQSFIDGTDISLVAINGSLSASSTQATSVDVRSVSSSTERVRLENDDSAGPLTITFTSQRSAAYWDFLEESQSTVDSVTSASSGNGVYNVSVALDPSRTYSLQLTKVGVGTGVTDAETAYLTDVEGDGGTVSQGETTELTLEVRDRFNNPPADAAQLRVNGSIAGDGSFQSSGAGDATKTPDEDGQVTFVYEATGSAGRQEIRFSYTTINGSFEASTPEDVSTNVTVESPSSGGSGRLVSLNDGRAFDGNGNGVAGAFSVTVENQVGQSVELTDVAVVPENTDINGLSDESGGTAPGESELAVEDLSTGETRVVELSLFTGDQYGFVSGRGTVLSLESPMNEETYSVSSGSFGSVETELTGSVIELGTGESAEITFAEFWTVGGTTAEPANVSDETFRLAVTYAAGGSRVADEFVVNVAPPSASPGNSPPTADIAGPSSASVGETVTFDASGSTDPDGDTLSYEWDLDDDGNFDDATGETASTSFSSTGDQTVTVRVSDDNGGVDTASQTVTVSSGSSGTIEGTVTDANTGNTLSNADITVFESGTTNVVATTTTDSNGQYSVSVAGGNDYDIEADGSSEGYDSSTAGSVTVNTGSTVVRDFQLAPVSVFGAATNWDNNNDDLDTEFDVSESGTTTSFRVNLDGFNAPGGNQGWDTKEVTIDGSTYTLTDQAANSIVGGTATDLLDESNYVNADQSTLNQYRGDVSLNSNVQNIQNNGAENLNPTIART
ncbi:carboxypeptidase regulatory-like domain-containing protein [Halomicroarcula sp. F28]|uniref:PKD domain-containing protein n=1 Tax=Haloarcula salinisoli TaxID=2487746 RepID=UPI001C72B2DB|nr:PKD domain-containing protein [Halomicroarcula salinisoli]MBX0287413.1 carboxypeptidase regulatory-like domain-containing protein [Halomicroarcula salinisoli]